MNSPSPSSSCSLAMKLPRRSTTRVGGAALLTLFMLLVVTPAGLAQVQAAAEEPAPATSRRAGPDDGILLNFQDASIEAVLKHLSEVTGLTIIKPSEVEGRITVISRQSLSVEQAVQLINSVLNVQGFAAVRTGDVLKLIPLSEVSTAGIPVAVGADPQLIPETDEVITQVIPLRSVQAPQLVDDLRPLIAPSAVLTANADSNTVVITDTAARVRRLVTVIAAIDRSQVGAMDVRVFPLQYARATDAAQLVNEIFGSGERAGQRNSREERIRAFMRRGRGGGNGDDSSESTLPGQTLQASADDRANAVVVSGAPELLDVVERVLSELDTNQASTQGVFIYPVKNGDAANLEGVLNTLFGTSDVASARNANGQAAGGRSGRGGRGGRGDNSQSAEGPWTGPRGPAADGDGAAQADQGQDQGRRGGRREAMREGMDNQLSGESLQTAGDLYGQVFVVSDEDSNSLLVMTAPGYFDAVRQILEEVDAPVPQVLIKALIAEVTHTDSLDLGAEFSILNAPDASSLFTSFGLATADGGMIYRLLEEDVTATLRALEEVGKLEVLSRPYILASDNQLATITVGSEVPFITSTQFTELGGVRNTVRYEDVGIILDVTPHIAPDGKVTMEVAPEISALSGESVAVSENVFLPVIEKRSAETRVAIHDGQTIVIGGLMEDRLTADIDKVPLLGDIPVLGHLFKRERTTKRKTELLIFLTPHIAAEAEVLGEMTEAEMRGVEIVPGAVEPGEYQRHLDALKPPRADEGEASVPAPLDAQESAGQPE